MEEKEFISLKTLCKDYTDMPLATARIYAAQGRLPGVTKMGARVYIHIPTFRAAMLKNARGQKNGVESGEWKIKRKPSTSGTSKARAKEIQDEKKY